MRPRADHVIAAYLLAIIAVVGIIVLAITDHDVPDVLEAVALFGGGVAGGATIPPATTVVRREPAP